MQALLVALAVLLPLASLPLALCHGHKARIVSAAAAGADGLPDGARCTLDANHQPVGLPCASSPFHCVVTRVPTPASAVFTGFCNSSYALGSHCMYTSQPYAVGTRGIKGNPACARCTCTNHPEKAQEVAAVAAAAADYAASINSIEGWRLAGTRAGAGGRSGVGSLIGVNTAECDCEDVGPCYVDWQGDLVKGPKGDGIICPETRRCMIHTVGGGGQDNDGRPVDQGTCEGFGEEAVCVAAGKSWGPKFYVEGTDGVPGPRGRCEECTCGENGALLACNLVRGCGKASGGMASANSLTSSGLVSNRVSTESTDGSRRKKHGVKKNGGKKNARHSHGKKERANVAANRKD
ncbi:unnamed protein product [Closterium sp. Yama58-4]|nr:unnamed protein product [Closterium sp. Yama58-4]